MAFSLDLALSLPCSNTGSLAANNTIDFGNDTDYWCFSLFDSPFATERVDNKVIHGVGVDAPSGLDLELKLCCGNNRNYDTGCKGSGEGEGVTSAAIGVCSDNSSVLLSAVEGGTSAAISSSSDANADDRCSSTRKHTSSGKGKQRSVRKKAEAWSIDEHHKFLEGYSIEGNKWIDIANKYVLTRNSKQVGSHAQKFFLKEHQSKEKANKKQRAGPPSILEIRDLPSDYIPVSERKIMEADDAFLITPPPVDTSRVEAPDLTNQQDPLNTGTNSMVESFSAMRVKSERQNLTQPHI